MLNIDNKISLLPLWRYILQSLKQKWRLVRQSRNVNNNKMVFSADNHVLIKLLRQEKKYGAKTFIAECPSKPWTLSGLNKRLPNTGHFTFWGDLTKAAVTVVCVHRFNWNMALWLPMHCWCKILPASDVFVKVTQMYSGVYLCNTIMVTEIFCYRYLTINNSARK